MFTTYRSIIDYICLQTECSDSATRQIAAHLHLRLAQQGLEWPDQRSQCVLSYFKLSMYYGLQYDPDFCQVRNPANIWALIQVWIGID
ncbi:hypothetical protein ANCDUO_15185 [Ancylostoma duodenale]|uniref:Uncharacterized protein n=1 Tax=Ancylostoma duodenale TaxID=51022 RepID=A0A0C2CEB6_9BILA|nr:hypothetical protein ANCDUO_15185 [Ancylostoma duodenale]